MTSCGYEQLSWQVQKAEGYKVSSICSEEAWPYSVHQASPEAAQPQRQRPEMAADEMEDRGQALEQSGGRARGAWVIPESANIFCAYTHDTETDKNNHSQQQWERQARELAIATLAGPGTEGNPEHRESREETLWKPRCQPVWAPRYLDTHFLLLLLSC